MTTPPRHPKRQAQEHRLQRLRAAAPTPPVGPGAIPKEVAIECGWGRLILAHTFDDPQKLAAALREERPDQRDIAFYVHEPHVLLASAPQELFLDPSHAYRLTLAAYRPARDRRRGFTIRRLSGAKDAAAVNRLYALRDMAPAPARFFTEDRDPQAMPVFVAIDDESGEIVGTVTGLDHVAAFGDGNGATSLWCLAVSPSAKHPGVGEALVRRLAELFKARGLATLDLSVMHDNEGAIALYTKIGFRRVPFFTVKRKNPRNEKLFIGPTPDDALNAYARIIIDEARRRGIHARIIDAEGGFFDLTWGGRTVRCRESLSEFTSGVAMSMCDDKATTRRIVASAGVAAPEQIVAGGEKAELQQFLKRHGAVVVKPARGEQGRGVAVGLTDLAQIDAAIAEARRISDTVLIEEYVSGVDLRILVIDFKVVAAATRLPPRIVGDGVSSARDLIAAQSRRREAATHGESRIPIDGETERCLAEASLKLSDIPAEGQQVIVRKTANLHTGGDLNDVTAELHPALAEAAVAAAVAIDIPTTGIDLIVKDATQPDYRFIEANERPGLANHEPQPTAERFIDMLFPLSAARPKT